jgi:hypothetical protein
MKGQYGYLHRQLRRAWAAQVALGGILCARCGERIDPGEPWDLGHRDGSRVEYAGPEHARCNRATNRKRYSREW